MTVPQLFSNGEFELPVIPDGDSFRVNATVVARQLGFGESKNMVKPLADDEKVLVAPHGKNAGRVDQEVWFITEPGFYKVVGQRNVNVIRDRKVREAVARFQRWVFHDVIPAMVRSGQASESSLVGTTWSWVDVSFEIRQRYGLDYSPARTVRNARTAGWLRNDGPVPKHPHRHQFWFTGTAYHLLPHALPDLVADMLPKLQQIGDPQANQYQLNINPSLPALPCGGESRPNS
ncbi:BRO-N domain-containing protein [Mycolicibacterium sp. A43C]